MSYTILRSNKAENQAGFVAEMQSRDAKCSYGLILHRVKDSHITRGEKILVERTVYFFSALDGFKQITSQNSLLLNQKHYVNYPLPGQLIKKDPLRSLDLAQVFNF